MSTGHRRSLPNGDNVLPALEQDALVEMLDFHRAVLPRKAEGLDAEQLGRTLGPSTLTLGGLVKHMAFVEDHWFAYRFAGHGYPEPWASAPWNDDHDWELNSAVDDMPDEIFELFDAAVERSRSVLARVESLDAESATEERERGRFNMRWILIHMIEEYARHNGHADLIRESIDGTTGD